MQSLAIVGAQWGDEGKGKITDLLGGRCDLVVRYQGGHNAGHTIVVGDEKIVLHLIPSGILHDHCTSVIAHGVAFDPHAFKEELERLRASGITIDPDKLKISQNCSVITTHAKLLDQNREAGGKLKIGTTGRGIGPTYEDKISRRGIKLKDLLDLKRLREKLKINLEEKEILFQHFYGITCPSLKEEAQQLFELGQVVAPFLCDSFDLIDRAFADGKKILYEGAQGVLLDIDYGSYPFVTSSNTCAGGIYTGAGLFGPGIEEVLGITKAYTTRVGEGPFPTELPRKTGHTLQTLGDEFGATTGRKRRCGWPDLPLLKYAVKASNLTSLGLTKLDILAQLDEIRICRKYHYRGREIDCAYPGIDLSQVRPIYEEIKPFRDSFDSPHLSPELENYIAIIEKAVGIPIGVLAYGPERQQIIFRRRYF